MGRPRAAVSAALRSGVLRWFRPAGVAATHLAGSRRAGATRRNHAAALPSRTAHGPDGTRGPRHRRARRTHFRDRAVGGKRRGAALLARPGIAPHSRFLLA